MWAHAGAAAAVPVARLAALRALRDLHKAQLQAEVEGEAQVHHGGPVTGAPHRLCELGH